MHELLLENPSDVPVIVQVLPLAHYPCPGTILNLLENSSNSDLYSILDSSRELVFSVEDLHPDHVSVMIICYLL